MNFKECPKCKKFRHWHQFYLTKKYSCNFGLDSWCKECRIKAINNPKQRIYQKQWSYIHNEKLSNQNKKWRIKNRRHVNLQKRKKRQVERDNLTDSYIKTTLQVQARIYGLRLSRKDISSELIELKRSVIEYKRELKKTKEAANEFFGNKLRYDKRSYRISQAS